MRRLLFLIGSLLSLANSATPPNFIVILADDLGYSDIGSYGHPTIRTRALDRMTAEGLKLTQFYSAAPICTPSRGAMLTGRLPIRSGLYTNTSFPKDLYNRVFVPSSIGCMLKSEVTIADALGAAGYYTALVGKWHLGHNPKVGCLPTDRGFQYFFGLPYSHEEGYPGPPPEGLIWPPVPLMRNHDIVQQPADMSTLTQRFVTETAAQLDMLSKKGQPFFLHVGFEEPHVPLFAGKDFLNTSRRGLFGDAVQQMDWAVGTILDKLRSTGLSNNTLVVFASDNGGWVNPSSGMPGTNKTNPLAGGSNAPFKDGKGSTWEGGLRGPAIAWWPGKIAPFGLSMEVTSMMDLFPTFLELAQVAPPKDVTLDGRSISDIFFNPDKATSPHDYVYFWREHTLMAVRKGPWKAHFWTRSGFEKDPPVKHDPPLLFNLEWDPAENVPQDVTQHQDLITDITNAYNNHIKTTTPGAPQYDNQDFSLVPCCHGPFNQTQYQEFVDKHEYGLAMWEVLGCVCL